MNANQEICQLCQSCGDHQTARCPKLVCAKCGEKGHARKDCPYLANPSTSSVEIADDVEFEDVKVQQNVDTKADPVEELLIIKSTETQAEMNNCQSRELGVLINELKELEEQFHFGQTMLFNLHTMLSYPRNQTLEIQTRIYHQIDLRMQSLPRLRSRITALRRYISVARRVPDSHKIPSKRTAEITFETSTKPKRCKEDILDLQQRFARLVDRRAKIQDNPIALEQNSKLIQELEMELSISKE